MPFSVLTIVLEFARAEQGGDPFAFRFAQQDYLLRTPGGGFEQANFPWDEALLSDLQALQRPGCDPVVVQRVGERLRRFLSETHFVQYEAQILSAVAESRPVALTLRSAAAELYALPWELLALKPSGQHLGELPGVLVRYEWPETKSASEEPSPRPDGQRILFAWSAAGGAVPAAEHLAAIDQACQSGFQSFSAPRDVLEQASYGRLQAALAAAKEEGKPIAILHLLCHGTAIGSTFGLKLNGDSATDPPVSVDAGQLRQLLSPYAGMLRLVVLMACDSGNNGALGNQLGSVAQTLHRGGIAAVIASRYPLSVEGSLHFAQAFYAELLGIPSSLEQAFQTARRALLRDTTHLDWASLQLYARSSDGEDLRPLVIRPFRGLLSFLPEHHRFFFGRGQEIEKITQGLGRLAAAGKPRFLVVAGDSGSGKS